MNKKQIILGILLVFLVIGFLKRELFFEKGSEAMEALKASRRETLRIVSSTPAAGISPEVLDLDHLLRTANIYEGLVAFDRKLKIIPSLAVSWGVLEPTRWEFKLRRDVRFHDGTEFKAEHVAESFKAAKGSLAEMLKTIKEIEVADDYTLTIVTHQPDPLMLSKLTKFFIHRGVGVGTGPYQVDQETPEGALVLKNFSDYWGRRPIFSRVSYEVIPGKLERQRGFENGEIDLLVSVPRDQALELPQEQIKKSFSLEVTFLMFKLDHLILKEKRIRQALLTVIDPARIEAIGNYFVRPVGQFVAPGVFGFNPEIPPLAFEESRMAKDLFGKRSERITLDFLESYRTLSEYLIAQLRLAGFLVQANPLSPERLLERIRKNESELYLLGWQAEDGDAGGFLDAFIESAGEFNGGRYKNAEVDGMIKAARQEMDPERRLQMLQTIFQKIQEDVIGLPIFESSRLYAVKPGITWEPRADGLVLAAEVK